MRELLETLKLIQHGSTVFTRTQKKAIEVMWRRGLLWKEVGTGVLHVSDKGEEVMRELEGNHGNQ